MRRVVTARVTDDDVVDDIVQETLCRLLDVRGRLDRAALIPYALTTARNLVASRYRTNEIAHRHTSGSTNRVTAPGPEEQALIAEEHRALAKALVRLDKRERDLLVQHEIDGKPAKQLARSSAVTPAALAAQLARARARLRLEYLLAFRRVRLPTDRCQSILLALSSSDRRRQRALGADRHLRSCPVCADIAPALTTRRRSLAAVLPLTPLASAREMLKHYVRNHPAQTATMATAIAAVGALAVAAFVIGSRQSATSGAPAAPTPPTSVQLPLPPGDRLSAHVGQPAYGDGLPVLSAPTVAGCWLGSSAETRVWMANTDPAVATLRPGDRVDVRGSVVPHDASYAQTVDLPTPDRVELAALQAHLLVPVGGLVRHAR